MVVLEVYYFFDYNQIEVEVEVEVILLSSLPSVVVSGLSVIGD